MYFHNNAPPLDTFQLHSLGAKRGGILLPLGYPAFFLTLSFLIVLTLKNLSGFAHELVKKLGQFFLDGGEGEGEGRGFNFLVSEI